MYRLFMYLFLLYSIAPRAHTWFLISVRVGNVKRLIDWLIDFLTMRSWIDDCLMVTEWGSSQNGSVTNGWLSTLRGNYPTRVSMHECLMPHTWLYLCVMLRSLMLNGDDDDDTTDFASVELYNVYPLDPLHLLSYISPLIPCICWVTYLPWSLASVVYPLDPLHLLSYISPLIPCICWVTYLPWSLASVELHTPLIPCICWVTYLPWSLASVELHIFIDPLHLLSYISPLNPCICWVTYLHWSLASVELHISLDPLHLLSYISPLIPWSSFHPAFRSAVQRTRRSNGVPSVGSRSRGTTGALRWCARGVNTSFVGIVWRH